MANKHPRPNLNVVALNFRNCSETLEDVFGEKPISPGEVIRILWLYVKLKDVKRRVIARKELGGTQPPPSPPPKPIDPLDDIRTFRRKRDDDGDDARADRGRTGVRAEEWLRAHAEDAD